MSKNIQFITKPILIKSDNETESNQDDIFNTLKTSESTMITDYNEINKYLEKTSDKKTHTIVMCSHSIDKDMNTNNIVTISDKDCSIIHQRSPLSKVILLKAVMLPQDTHKFKRVKLGMVKLPKPTKTPTASKGKCVKRKKNIT